MSAIDIIKNVWRGLSAPATQTPTMQLEERGTEGRFAALNTPTPNLEKTPTIIGPNLTPARVSSALRKAEQGYMRGLVELCTELRETTPQLQSELLKRESSVAGVGWAMHPAKT